MEVASLALLDARDPTGGECSIALKPLWACWRALYAAREKRGPLELDLPERRVMLDEKGRILSVAPRERLDAHKLIEDYMIAANVAAAKALEAKKAPVMYRVHEPPSREKLVALKDYLKTFGIEFALGQVVRPATFNRIIERVGEAEFRPQVMEQILRTQTQAYYGPLNHGHFGLALGSYAPFHLPDPPLRRSRRPPRAGPRLPARAKGGADRRGSGGDGGDRRAHLQSRAPRDDRRARDDGPLCRRLPLRAGRRVVDAGSPACSRSASSPPSRGWAATGWCRCRARRQYFRYDEAARARRRRGRHVYALGQRLTLRLAEANPVSGALRFELPEGGGRPRRIARAATRVARQAARTPSNIRTAEPERNAAMHNDDYRNITTN